MKVFLTGASGFVGSAVLKELLAHGHSVLGLVRSAEGEARVRDAGGTPVRGTLDDIEGVSAAASAADAIIHTGFNHDFSRFKESCEADQRLIAGFGRAFAGTRKPILITSAIGVLARGTHVTEKNQPSPQSPNPRVLTEFATHELQRQGLNASVVRLPP